MSNVVRDSRLRKALEILRGPSWELPGVRGSWDYNTEDILHIARALHINLPPDKSLPEAKIDERRVVEIAEIVDNYFIEGIMRSLFAQSFNELCDRAENTAKKVMKIPPGVGSVEALIVALYLWHGCICMAKLTREVDAHGTPYNLSQRMGGYKILKSDWESEERSGNGWIKLGVTVAKRLETERAKRSPKKIIDDWVPPDSPYWDNWRSRT